MKREIFSEEHELFRDQVRRFVEREVEPKIPDWNERGMVDRATWRRTLVAGLAHRRSPPEPSRALSARRPFGTLVV